MPKQVPGAGANLMKKSFLNTPTVLDPLTYWSILIEGSDAAGYYTGATALAGGPALSNEAMAAGFMPMANGGIRFWDLPILWDPNFNTNTGTTKAGIVADWKAFKLYRGDEFRIDMSDVAGSRWDQNLVGFRGEEEIGFNASTAVAVGAAQLVTNLIP